MTNEIKTWSERFSANYPNFPIEDVQAHIRAYWMEREIADLRAKVKSLEADAERLDWLAKNSAYVAVNPHHKTCLWTLRNIFDARGDDFRTAIDTAMAKEKAL